MLYRFIFVGLISMFGLCAAERIYIDQEEYDDSQELSRVHIGHNIWYETDVVYKDETGVFTLDNHISRKSREAIKKWKCPYCYYFWPVGTPCQNSCCPSKYR